MQKRMIDALQAIPGVEQVGLADVVPLGVSTNDSNVFNDNASDLRPSNAAADAILYKISPEYLRAAGTAILSGRIFTWDSGRRHLRHAAPRTAGHLDSRAARPLRRPHDSAARGVNCRYLAEFLLSNVFDERHVSKLHN
jgi:hypothetical protein